MQNQLKIIMNEDMLISSKLRRLVKKAARRTLTVSGFKNACEVGILICNNKTIREKNKEFRNLDKPTDVLSFPMLNMKNGIFICNITKDRDPGTKRLLLGDLVISHEMATYQAKEYGHAIEREMCFLAVHGMLHLLGYHHEDKSSEKTVTVMQELVLASMGLLRDTGSISVSDGYLAALAKIACSKAYAPYSQFKVGAALSTSSGKVFTGSNIENASYGATCCAERVALYKAVSEGFKDISAIAVAVAVGATVGAVAGEVAAMTENCDNIRPCGICLQTLAEFASSDTRIICVRQDNSYDVFRFNDLLPEAFRLIQN